MIFLNLGLLALIGTGAWWLTGVDKTPGGESKRSHHFTRALRCIAVIFLSWAFIWFIENPGLGAGGIPFLIIIPVSIALVLRSSAAEVFAGGFMRLIDPTLHDHRPLDPGKSQRHQDTIARLIRNGRRDEAIKLCEELKQTGEVDLVTLENTLEFLGVPQNRRRENPLSQAARLRVEGDFSKAEKLLRAMLAKNPADAGAAMLLLRLCAQDLRQPNRAHELLRVLEKQAHLPASHLEFARRSIAEWSRHQPEPAGEVLAPKADSVDDLLAQGFFGSAVEMLEREIRARPQNFELQLKLAEVFAVNCKNLPRAEKIIRQMERVFSPAQVETARAKLADWRSASKPPLGTA
jgi:hypothetical protein